MTQVIVVIGAGQIGQAIARRPCPDRGARLERRLVRRVAREPHVPRTDVPGDVSAKPF